MMSCVKSDGYLVVLLEKVPMNNMMNDHLIALHCFSMSDAFSISSLLSCRLTFCAAGSGSF